MRASWRLILLHPSAECPPLYRLTSMFESMSKTRPISQEETDIDIPLVCTFIRSIQGYTSQHQKPITHSFMPVRSPASFRNGLSSTATLIPQFAPQRRSTHPSPSASSVPTLPAHLTAGKENTMRQLLKCSFRSSNFFRSLESRSMSPDPT